MTDDLESGALDSERWLRRWMIGVGVVYLLLALNLSSLLVAHDRIYLFFPPFDAALDSVAFAVAADLAFLSGLSHAVIGAFLLWASRRPMAYVSLVPLVLALELVVGIVDDLYLIFLRDYPIDAVYYGFILLHLVIIVTGYKVYQRRD